MTSSFVTSITHFPIILRITFPTPIGRTASSSLSRGKSRLAKIASIPRGSINSVHKRGGIAAIAVHRSVTDFLNDFDSRICRNPFASTPEGTPEPFVRRAKYLYKRDSNISKRTCILIHNYLKEKTRQKKKVF